MDDHPANPLRTDGLAEVGRGPSQDRSVAVSIKMRLAELFEGLDGDIVGDSVDLMQSFERRAAETIDAIEHAVAADDAPTTQ